MEKTRGAHSFRPQVRQGPTPPAAGPFTAGSSAAADPSTTGPSAAAAGASPSVPVVHPLDAGDAEGSSSVAPA